MLPTPPVSSELGHALSDIKAINDELLKLEGLRKRREFLKILLIGFLLYRDLESKRRFLCKRKKTCIEALECQATAYFESLKAKIENSLNSDYPISNDKQTCLLTSLNACLETINLLLNEFSVMKENNWEQKNRFLSYIAELSLLRNRVITHNTEVKKMLLNNQFSQLKPQLLQADYQFNTLFIGDRYFSKKDLHDWKLSWSQIITKSHELLNKATQLGFELDCRSTIMRLTEVLNDGETIVKKRNEDFILTEAELFGNFFDTIERNPLAAEQRKAIVTDEESILVVAGAGTGKTSTIVGKVGYIIKKRLAEPQEILVLSFNTKVAEELRTRLSKLQNQITIKTYHSFGKDVITQCNKQSASVSVIAEDKAKLSKKITEFLNYRCRDPKFARLLNEYFLYLMAPYKSEFEFKSFGEYIRYLRQFDLRSLKGDRVKSFEECYIANFLYINGITYEYERKYEEMTVDEDHRQYRPDFYLPDYKLYIEHFGINRDGEPAPFISSQKYKVEIEWKRGIHARYKTHLIETYSYEQKEGKLLQHLEQKLLGRGVRFSPIPQELVFAEINELGRIKQLTLLLGNFLNLFKASGKTISQLRQQTPPADERTHAFLTIFSAVYDDYTAYLKNNQEIDFNDMLVEATALINSGTYKSNYRYILVDEFQDISVSRYSFLKALQDQNKSKVFCVGDDWQSIYRFTGSDVSLMVDFPKNFTFHEVLTLTHTFRFNNKISDFSSKFILSNPLQIKKHLVTEKRAEKPAVLIVRGEPESVLAEILNNLSTRLENQAKAYVIGRYRPRQNQLYLYDFPKKIGDLTVEYTTAHSSKGLEADYVIVIGLTDGRFGFPCQITDDPVLNLVLAREAEFPNAEERRLFYVAVTRAKKQVFLVYEPFKQPSSFLVEIQKGSYEVESNYDVSQLSFCPKCKTGEITKKKTPKAEFYSCNNYPYCDYTPHKCPLCRQGYLYRDANFYRCSQKECTFHARICPGCDEGFIVKRSSRNGGLFFGCSRYPKCNYIERPNASVTYVR